MIDKGVQVSGKKDAEKCSAEAAQLVTEMVIFCCCCCFCKKLKPLISKDVLNCYI